MRIYLDYYDSWQLGSLALSLLPSSCQPQVLGSDQALGGGAYSAAPIDTEHVTWPIWFHFCIAGWHVDASGTTKQTAMHMRPSAM